MTRSEDINAKHLRERAEAEALYADPDHPGKVGREAEEALAEDMLKPLDGHPAPFQDPEFRHSEPPAEEDSADAGD